MIRSAICLAALFGVGSVASAGELDKEAKKAAPPVAVSPLKAGTELDAESPTEAWYSRGHWGHHHHYHGGFGYGGFGGYRGYYGGFGYRPYYAGYNPYFYRPAYYRPYYGGFGYGGGFGGGFGYRGGYVSFGYAGW